MKSYYCTIIVESTSFVMLFNRNYWSKYAVYCLYSSLVL